MFRKPKRKAKDALRKKDDIDNEDETSGANVGAGKGQKEPSTSELLAEARQRLTRRSDGPSNNNLTKKNEAEVVMHAYNAGKQAATTGLRDLVTSTAEHHPRDGEDDNDKTSAATRPVPNDGIFRGDKVHNKFHAGPIRAAAHVRVTARFDYQPDVCKDYKETGFCGYGDTCIYLHDRGDTISGWQLEQQWEVERQTKKARQEQEMNDFATGKSTPSTGTTATTGDAVTADDDATTIPFACHLCRGPFDDPVVTRCHHYFCQACILNHVRTTANSDACPICNKDTGAVFNQPTKLLAKRRKVLGAQRAKDDDAWQQYLAAFQGVATAQDD